MIRRLLSWIGVMTPEHRATYAELCRQYAQKKDARHCNADAPKTKISIPNIPPRREAVKQAKGSNNPTPMTHHAGSSARRPARSYRFCKP